MLPDAKPRNNDMIDCGGKNHITGLELLNSEGKD